MMMRCLPQAVGGISQAASQQQLSSNQQQQQLSTPSGQQPSSAAASNSQQTAAHAGDAADAGAQRLQVPKPPGTVSVGGSGGGATASGLTTGVVDSPSAAIPSPLMAHGLGATGDPNADASMPTLSPQPLDKKALSMKQEQLAAGGGTVAAAVARDVTAWTMRGGDDPSLLSAAVAGGETELKLGPGIVAVYSNETSSCGGDGGDDSPTTAADSDDNDGGDGATRRQQRRRRRRREPTLYKTEAINTWLDAQQRSLTTSHCGADGGGGVTVAAPAAESKLKRPLLGTQLYETLPLDDEDCDAKRFCDFETLHQWYVRTAAVAAHARGSCVFVRSVVLYKCCKI